jgi:hypothetical protein
MSAIEFAVERLLPLVEKSERADPFGALSEAYEWKAVALYQQRKPAEAGQWIDRAVAMYERAINEKGCRRLRGEWSRAMALRAEIRAAMGDKKAAAADARVAMDRLRSEIQRTRRADLQLVLDEASARLAQFL